MSKQKFECEFCDQVFGKKTILTRHIKKVHVDDEAKTATQFSPKGAVEEDWDKDPGELEVGRTYQKKTPHQDCQMLNAKL